MTEPEKEQVTEFSDEVKALQEALEEIREKAQANLAGWQRTQSDFINYKKRCEQEKGDIAQYANCNFVLCLLPVLDDWERAFKAIPAELAEDKWVKGIKLIERKLFQYLEGQGVVQIKALGEKFDPAIHEAAVCCPGPEDIVIDEMLKGYTLHGRVIRPSKVIVGSGEEPELEKEE